MLSVLGAVAQFERDKIKERQMGFNEQEREEDGRDLRRGMLCVIFHSIAFILFARGAWESQAERVAYSIATDRLNLNLDNTSAGTDMKKKFQGCWHMLAPLLLQSAQAES